MVSGMKQLSASLIATVSLAVIDLVGIAIVTKMKENSLVDNTTADQFVTGLTLVAGFIGLIILVLVGAFLIKIVRGAMKN